MCVSPPPSPAGSASSPPAGATRHSASPRRRPRGHTFGPATRTGAATTTDVAAPQEGAPPEQQRPRTLRASTGAPGILAGRGSRFAPRPAQGRQDDPTSCSTGQASLASHPITSGCSLDSRRENWTERESCDLWDGKLRQTVVSALRGRPRLNYLNLQLAHGHDSLISLR